MEREANRLYRVSIKKKNKLLLGGQRLLNKLPHPRTDHSM